MKKLLFNAVCLLIALLSGISLFVLKYQVKEQERHLQTIHQDILKNKREIHMLEAEWAHLNDPQRLLALVASQTDWKTISSKQISTLSDIPLKQRVLPAEAEVIELQSDKKETVKQAAPKEIMPVLPREKTERMPEKKTEKSTVKSGAASAKTNATHLSSGAKTAKSENVSHKEIKMTESLKKGTAALSSLSHVERKKP